jgi:hypothetical protein
VPPKTTAYTTPKIKDDDEANKFNQIRPDFKQIEEDVVEKELDVIDEKELKMETIDFSYVPVSGWQSEGNSIYQMSVVSNNIKLHGANINSTGAFEIDRLGYMNPETLKYTPPITKEEQNKTVVPAMVFPMIESEDLQWNIPFINKEPSLNYDTKPSQGEDFNMFWDAYKNSQYMPDYLQQAFVSANTLISEIPRSTEPPDNKINATAVGISNGGVFDAVN